MEAEGNAARDRAAGEAQLPTLTGSGPDRHRHQPPNYPDAELAESNRNQAGHPSALFDPMAIGRCYKCLPDASSRVTALPEAAR